MSCGFVIPMPVPNDFYAFHTSSPVIALLYFLTHSSVLLLCSDAPENFVSETIGLSHSI